MNWEITKQVAAAAIRWALAFVGALLVKQGIIDQQMADAWLGEITATLLGLIILAIPVIWKILNARFNIIALIKAVQTEPPADTPREIKAAVQEAQQAASDDSRLTASV